MAQAYRNQFHKVVVNTTKESVEVLLPLTGMVFVLNHLSAYDADNNVTAIAFNVGRSELGTEFCHVLGANANVRLAFNDAGIVVMPDEHIYVDVFGGTAGDDLYVSVHGFLLTQDEYEGYVYSSVQFAP